MVPPGSLVHQHRRASGQHPDRYGSGQHGYGTARNSTEYDRQSDAKVFGGLPGPRDGRGWIFWWDAASCELWNWLSGAEWIRTGLHQQYEPEAGGKHQLRRGNRTADGAGQGDSGRDVLLQQIQRPNRVDWRPANQFRFREHRTIAGRWIGNNHTVTPHTFI